ncbi:NAD(P)/FAD-dependent oxidoreductase [Thermomicrobium sp. CFH 73360]|uniref:NAD(P)/FAD-dependent oxidoreductase n=1 Tax=Thermomicrobium sp. CFH 73360 TaxID=2951987 RepID=UPI00207747AE|nr:NAD(P)/FAD-dependent oxidoreductase [Thermomicrobium sp. CFH 73360]MCM8747122.1 NAD(P)/FAD-dependent oxidoreductase [Thermomicrobium sp. CFH 73360]
MSTRLRIGVIGGGIAGLTAAYRLASRGHEVILWERQRQLGGQAAAFPLLGTALEYFYHHLFMSDHDIVALMKELGIADRLVWLPSRVGFYAAGRIYPLSSALDVLRLGVVPLHDRLRIGLVTFYLQHVRDWRRFEEITAEEWLRRWVGARAFDRVWGAQLRAKFGPRASDVAMVWFWNKIFLRTQSRRSLLERERLGYIMGSFNALIDRLAEAIREQSGTVLAGVGVDAVERSGDTWVVRESTGRAMPVDVIVATVPSPLIAKLFPQLPEIYRMKLLGTVYQAAVTLLLQTHRELSDIYWLNIGDPDLPYTGIIEHTNFVPASYYQGRHLIYVSKYVEQTHPYLALRDDEVLAAAIQHLPKVNPAFSADWIEDYWVFRERAAQPIVTVRYRAQIPDHRTPLPGVYVANTAQIYPEDRGTNYSVRLGNVVADLVCDDVRTGRLGVATSAARDTTP